MSKELYYTAPNDEMFEDIRQAAVQIWETYDNTHGYVTEKLKIVYALTNTGDNYMAMFSMFDPDNQRKLLALVKPETSDRIIKALK